MSNEQENIWPKISVIVPIYNGEADLPDFINCLKAQNYPTDRVEYLLVDNGSSDRTSAILKSVDPPQPPPSTGGLWRIAIALLRSSKALTPPNPPRPQGGLWRVAIALLLS